MTLEEIKQKTAQAFGYPDWDSILADYKAGEINDKIFKGIIDNVANSFAIAQVMEVALKAINSEKEQNKQPYSGFQEKLRQAMSEAQKSNKTR